MRWLLHPRVVRGCQIGIGLLFAWAALTKLGDLPSFAVQIHNFRMMPVAVENLVALTLPWVELLAALALIFDVRPRSGAAVVGALLVLFTVGVLVAMGRGLDIECGCFGTSDVTRVGVGKVAQNLGMLLLAWVALQRSR
jgi:hypothetical protein